MDINIPLGQHVAILGREECGKTNVAKIHVDVLLADQRKVVIIDPFDSWWGMRLDADGQQINQHLVIFGGDHGDMRLLPTHGTAIADLAEHIGQPMIISLSKFSAAERARFFADFATAIVRLNDFRPLNLVIDDCEIFFDVPNTATVRRLDQATTDMIQAAQNLLASAKHRKISTILLSAFPGRLGDTILSRMQMIVIMRMASPADRGVMKQWLAASRHPEAPAAFDSLPQLMIGEGWSYQPNVKRLERFTAPRSTTWDVMSPLEAGPRKIDTISIEIAMDKACVDQGRSHDVSMMQKQIDDLKRRLAAPEAAAAASRVLAERNAAELGFAACVTAVTDHMATANITIGGLDDAIEKALQRLPSMLIDQGSPSLKPETIEYRERRLESSAVAMTEAERKLLTAIVQCPGSMIRRAALIAGYRHQDGIVVAAIGMLRRRRLIAPGLPLIPTPNGVDVLGNDFDILPTGRDLAAWWSNRLTPFARLALHQLIKSIPDGYTSTQLRLSCGGSTTAKDIAGALAELESCGLVTKGSGNKIRPVTDIFA